MSLFPVESVLETCTANAAQLAVAFNQCFGSQLTFQTGEAGLWKGGEDYADGHQAGIALVFEVGGRAAACLIAEGLPIPGWFRAPDKSQQGRLEALAREWALNMFPSDVKVTRSSAIVVPDLVEFVSACQPAMTAVALPLDAMDGEAPSGSVLVVCPLEEPQFAAISEQPVDRRVPPPSAPTTRQVDALARLRPIPVPISVRLAEKRIQVSQLLSITPGALITFNKSCEDLLELYVNNALICRGEAVKIGENFGLKINQLGVPQQQQSKLVTG